MVDQRYKKNIEHRSERKNVYDSFNFPLHNAHAAKCILASANGCVQSTENGGIRHSIAHSMHTYMSVCVVCSKQYSTSLCVFHFFSVDFFASITFDMKMCAQCGCAFCWCCCFQFGKYLLLGRTHYFLPLYWWFFFLLSTTSLILSLASDSQPFTGQRYNIYVYSKTQVPP